MAVFSEKEIRFLKEQQQRREESHTDAWNGVRRDAHFLGAVGEAAFLKDVGQSIKKIGSQGTDPGWDFEISGVKVDIKTKDWPKDDIHFLIKEGRLFADVYVGYRWDEKTRTATYLGWATKDTVSRCPVKQYPSGLCYTLDLSRMYRSSNILDAARKYFDSCA